MLPRASLDIVCMRYLWKVDSFRILYGDFYLKSYMLQMRSRDLFVVKHVHIYIQTFTWCLYVSNGECILYEFYVSFIVYLQWTMFDFHVMNGQYASLGCNFPMSRRLHYLP